MADPNPPRFRIRLEDGAELPVGSVEALARRVARGDVGPATHLFDGSTGKWHAAADAPVVQFILDELRRERRDLPPEWEAPVVPPADVASPQVEVASPPVDVAPPDPTPAPAPSSPAAQPPRDPLDLKLTPAAQTEDLGPALKNAFASPEAPSSSSLPPALVPAEQRRPAEPVSRMKSPRARDDEWLRSASEGGLFAGATASTEEAEPDPPAEEVIAPLPRRRPTRQPERPWATWFGIGLVAVTVVVGAGILLGDGGQDAEGSGPISPATGAGPTPSPPVGLEAAAERAISIIDGRFASAVDSARAAAGLASAPPEAWLTGYYLANADEFPEVREYWLAYGDLLEELRVLDRTVVGDVIDNDLGTAVVAANERSGLVAYIEERYAAVLPRRLEVYTQLSAVATGAVDLHDFLTQSGEAIEYTPALGGQAIPRDPVLEVGTDDPAVREGLESRLDAIFAALERSRGGGAPAQAGLEEELFGRLGSF